MNFIPAHLYSLVYMLIIIAFAIPVCYRYSRYSANRVLVNAAEPLNKSLLFTILIIIYIGNRPNSPLFADGPGYWAAIENHKWEYITVKEANFQFATKYLIASMSMMQIPPRIGFYVYAIIEYGFALLAMRKLFPKDTLLAMIMYCGAFCTFGGAVNGIKNGMALSVFLFALAYRDNWKLFIPLLLLSIGFHHSMQLSIAAFFICKFYKKTRIYYALWFFGIIIAALHITYFQTFFADYTDESGQGYLITDSNSWVTGFRPDFILYSAVPLIIGWWCIKKKRLTHEGFTFTLNVYLVMNTIWLLCMYSAFTNRIAALSWAIFPIILLYPFLKIPTSNKQYKYAAYAVWGQLIFTTYMTLNSL